MSVCLSVCRSFYQTVCCLFICLSQHNHRILSIDWSNNSLVPSFNRSFCACENKRSDLTRGPTSLHRYVLPSRGRGGRHRRPIYKQRRQLGAKGIVDGETDGTNYEQQQSDRRYKDPRLHGPGKRTVLALQSSLYLKCSKQQTNKDIAFYQTLRVSFRIRLY